MESRPPAVLLLLLLLVMWLEGFVSGVPLENVYKKVQRSEGDTLSVQCSYKHRKNRATVGKTWCKIRRKMCETNFDRSWAMGPRYLLQDDTQAKVIHVTMGALTLQDSGQYWCVHNMSGKLFPLGNFGFQLQVFPALTTSPLTRPASTPLTRPASTLSSGIFTTTQASVSGPDVPFTSGVTDFTSGLFTRASGTTRPTSMTHYSLPSPSPHPSTSTVTSTTEPRRTLGPQPVTVSPTNARTFSAGSASPSTESRHLSSGLPTTVMCHPLTSISTQETYLAGFVAVLTFLPAPVVMVVVYGFWKKRHTRSYDIVSISAKPWTHPPEGPEPLWKPA